MILYKLIRKICNSSMAVIVEDIIDNIIEVFYSFIIIREEEYNTLQRELAEKVPETKLEQELQNTNSDSIALALPENSVLIEIVRFDVYNPLMRYFEELFFKGIVA